MNKEKKITTLFSSFSTSPCHPSIPSPVMHANRSKFHRAYNGDNGDNVVGAGADVQVSLRRGLQWRQLDLSRTLNDYNVHHDDELTLRLLVRPTASWALGGPEPEPGRGRPGPGQGLAGMTEGRRRRDHYNGTATLHTESGSGGGGGGGGGGAAISVEVVAMETKTATCIPAAATTTPTPIPTQHEGSQTVGGHHETTGVRRMVQNRAAAAATVAAATRNSTFGVINEVRKAATASTSVLSVRGGCGGGSGGGGGNVVEGARRSHKNGRVLHLKEVRAVALPSAKGKRKAKVGLRAAGAEAEAEAGGARFSSMDATTSMEAAAALMVPRLRGGEDGGAGISSKRQMTRVAKTPPPSQAAMFMRVNPASPASPASSRRALAQNPFAAGSQQQYHHHHHPYHDCHLPHSHKQQQQQQQQQLQTYRGFALSFPTTTTISY